MFKEASHIDPRRSLIQALIRDIADFPSPGIGFKDITPLLAEPSGLRAAVDLIADAFAAEHVDQVVGIESRGFVFGAAVAYRLGAGFVPVRKPGKLPAAVHRIDYELEYGNDAVEMHRDALGPDSRVLVVDDVLATGGTARATGDLVGHSGAELVGYAFVIELAFLDGRKRLSEAPVLSLVQYD
jgi:adenine phosphoribosyltransferase